MKSHLIASTFSAGLVLFNLIVTGPNASGADATLKTDQEKLGYAIGMNVGMGLAKNLKTEDVDADIPMLISGFKDALTGGPTLLTTNDLQTIFNEMHDRQVARAKVRGEKNKKEGDDFLAKNKTEPGVITLPDGLQYKILQSTTNSPPGDSPTAMSTVKVLYRGTFLDGAVFDSSLQPDAPAAFRVGGVIPGWTEALQMMKVGDKWKLFIPANLAYGERGSAPQIGPNSTLIFEVELMGIAK